MKLRWTGRFSAAHRLQWHGGKCKRLHGHTYVVHIEIEDNVNERGVIIDFGELNTIVQTLDHRTLLSKGDPLVNVLDNDEYVIIEPYPTSEKIAEWILNKVVEKGFKRVSVTVEESPGNSVTVVMGYEDSRII